MIQTISNASYFEFILLTLYPNGLAPRDKGRVEMMRAKKMVSDMGYRQSARGNENGGLLWYAIQNSDEQKEMLGIIMTMQRLL